MEFFAALGEIGLVCLNKIGVLLISLLNKPEQIQRAKGKHLTPTNVLARPSAYDNESVPESFPYVKVDSLVKIIKN